MEIKLTPAEEIEYAKHVVYYVKFLDEEPTPTRAEWLFEQWESEYMECCCWDKLDAIQRRIPQKEFRRLLRLNHALFTGQPIELVEEYLGLNAPKAVN